MTESSGAVITSHKSKKSHNFFSSREQSNRIYASRKMGFGEYPAEYIPEKHGPYDPARYYGKRKH